MMEEQDALVEAVKQAAVEREGRTTLSCAEAFAVARKFGASLDAVGAACNKARVKIVDCQLGCFK